MGLPMAMNLARAGFALGVYNRSPGRTEPLLDLGARIADSPRTVASGADVVVTMLTGGDAVEEVLSVQRARAAPAPSVGFSWTCPRSAPQPREQSGAVCPRSA